MLSILVGHSYFLRFDRKQLERAKPYPPLATLQTAAALRRQGHRVAVFDAMLAEGPGEFERQLQTESPDLVVLYEDNFNFLTKMCLARMRDAARRMIGFARAAGVRVYVSGSDPSDQPRVYLEAGADAVLLGEGLVALDLLVARTDADASASIGVLAAGIAGVAYAVDGVIKLSSSERAAASHEHPDAPAFDLIDLDRYRQTWRAAHDYFSLNMAASRGCSFRCNWCAKPIWGHRYLQRPAGEVAIEMAALKRLYAPDHIWFADDIFGFRVEWVRQFAVALAESGGSIPFTIQTRADLISARMAGALAEAGCREAWIGAESGSQRVLDAMDKGTTVEEIHAARERLRQAGIRVGFFIQLGYLGEELDDLLATRALIESARPDAVGVSVSYPLPGTKFYERVREQLGAKTHWNDSDDLEMMFHGSYSSEFYRIVRDLIHAQVDADQLPGDVHGDGAGVRRTAIHRRWNELLATEHRYRGERVDRGLQHLAPAPSLGLG
jgi:anaerobic magnesium-protoporphyrin IX monomethyl ester cyclase